MKKILRKKSGRVDKGHYFPLRRLTGLRFVDIHCHCLAGLDDGPRDMTESLMLCRALVADGISTVIATPHQMGCYENYNNAVTVRRSVSLLNDELRRKGISLKVLPGADVRVDERIPNLLKADQVLTLADSGHYILLELPHDTTLDLRPLLQELDEIAVTAILSHPERNDYLIRHPQAVIPWLEHNCCLQITAGSLGGLFGKLSQEAAWHFLTSSAAVLIATDAHNLESRRPCMFEAFRLIAERLGEPFARRACLENPQRVLMGKDIIDLFDRDSLVVNR